MMIPDSGIPSGMGMTGKRKRTDTEVQSSADSGRNRGSSNKKHVHRKRRSSGSKGASGKRGRKVSKDKKSIISGPLPYLLIAMVLLVILMLYESGANTEAADDAGVKAESRGAILSESYNASTLSEGGEPQNGQVTGTAAGQAENVQEMGVAAAVQAQNVQGTGAAAGQAQNVQGTGAAAGQAQNVQGTGAAAGQAQNVQGTGAAAGQAQSVQEMGAAAGQNLETAAAPTDASEQTVGTGASGTGESDDAVPVESIEISADTDLMAQCDTLQLSAKVSPKEADAASLLWYSDDETIARVSQTGMVTSVGSGSTVINVVSSNGITTSFPIHVEADRKVMTMTVTSECAYNDKVGLNWTYRYLLDGEPIHDPQNLMVEAGREINLEAEIIDHDRQPDIGTAGGSYTVDEASIAEGFDITQEVVVTENDGNLTGNTASFLVTYHFTGAVE